MSSRPDGPIYIGCATDPSFVDMTGAMLSSLDDLGDVPTATVLVADFDLDEADRLALRRSAGSLGSAMRFIPVRQDSARIASLPPFDFPLAMLGRLFLPEQVTEPGARLLLLDSDTIVNTSLHPLLRIDMQGHPLAAVEDPFCTRYCGRTNYFNSGVMLLDLDLFNGRDVAGSAIEWLVSRPSKPDFPDQDALNTILDGGWMRLDRRWNYFHAGDDRQFELADYQRAFIIHYAGHKPWRQHVAASLYYYRLAVSFERRIQRSAA